MWQTGWPNGFWKRFEMPVILRLEGYSFLFYSNEGNPREPAHIHVRKARDEAKFWLLPVVALAYNDGLTPRNLKRAQQLVEEHREKLEGAWNEYFA